MPRYFMLLSITVDQDLEGYHGGLTEFFVDDLRLRRAAAIEPQGGQVGPEPAGTWKFYLP